jgi:hypothetical protein
MSRASVTMMGWMRKTEMSVPLKAPAATETSSASKTATPTPMSRLTAAIAAAIAITEPTERSMPPVAITSVMPTATRTVGATCSRIVRKLLTSAKFGVKIMLATSSKRRAAAAPYVGA